MDTWGKKVHLFRGTTLIQISHIFLGFSHISMWDSHKRQNLLLAVCLRAWRRRIISCSKKFLGEFLLHPDVSQVARCPPNWSVHFAKLSCFCSYSKNRDWVMLRLEMGVHSSAKRATYSRRAENSQRLLQTVKTLLHSTAKARRYLKNAVFQV